jgi:hypothetical protein
MRRQLAVNTNSSAQDLESIKAVELLGEGTFGKVRQAGRGPPGLGSATSRCPLPNRSTQHYHTPPLLPSRLLSPPAPPLHPLSPAKVYKGLWRGTTVAVKTMILPANMSGAEKREKMAVMEAAISSSLSHPNVVQVRFVCGVCVWGGGRGLREEGGSMEANRAVRRVWGVGDEPAPSDPAPLSAHRPQTYTYAIRPLREASTGSGDSLPEAHTGGMRT